MKSLQHLLEQKEAELQRLQQEVQAIRTVVRLLQEEKTEFVEDELKTVPITSAVTLPPPRTHRDNGRAVQEHGLRQFP